MIGGSEKGGKRRCSRQLNGRGWNQLAAVRHDETGCAAHDRPLAPPGPGLLTRTGLPWFSRDRHHRHLLNGWPLDYSQQMAAHESTRTTKLYYRRNDALDQVEQIEL